MKFTSLAHLLNKQALVQCHHELPNKKATGINGTTKEQYSENLEEHIEDLVSRLRRKSYRPVPVRRMYIPKLNSNKKRPLGIPEHEDKVVQKGITKILNTIYENDFLDCSFGFRPNRSCHDALKILNFYIEKRSVNYVVDVDIRGFFDNVDHKWMMEFLKLRIADPNLLRIIGRFLKGGYMEEGKKCKNLEITEGKTKIIPFGRFAEKYEKQKGNSKPATFDFLGFTHYCGKSKQGKFRVKRKSRRKKVQGKLKESKEWLKKNRNKDIHMIMDRFRRSLIGYYNYYCITDNTQNVSNFKDKIENLLFKWLNRRSQRKSFTWDKFRLFLDKYPLPSPRIKVNIYDLRKEICYIL